MSIDEFAPNLSFFFSNGMDPEYTVIGRVARRIWARAMRERYGASARSQMLKYHIQTSGRSLHAQEISFNDIRTTLQSLYALFDNCNSLHTNAFDEAITTPTEQSVHASSGSISVKTRGRVHSSSTSLPILWKKLFTRSSTASRSEVACLAPWIPCISVARSRTKAFITKARSTTGLYR
jgi:hypothetical protein